LSTPKADVVNKQPPPAPGMSTDPNGPEQRAMRLRGGCMVRHSSTALIPIIQPFFRNARYPVGAVIYRAAVKKKSADGS
jgi:hypothetical protein